jgi:hypothetical protein
LVAKCLSTISRCPEHYFIVIVFRNVSPPCYVDIITCDSRWGFSKVQRFYFDIRLIELQALTMKRALEMYLEMYERELRYDASREQISWEVVNHLISYLDKILKVRYYRYGSRRYHAYTASHG